MNKKKIDTLIPKAIGAITQKLAKNGSVDRVYAGYLASFGPTVVTSGLLQTVMFFEGDENKKKVIDLMFALIKDELSTNGNSLADFLTQNDNHKDYAIKHKVLEANIACKLAIRTFALKD